MKNGTQWNPMDLKHRISKSNKQKKNKKTNNHNC